MRAFKAESRIASIGLDLVAGALWVCIAVIEWVDEQVQSVRSLRGGR